MHLFCRLSVVLVLFIASLSAVRAAEPLAEMVLGADQAPYEYPIVRALGDDSEIWAKQAGGQLPLDPEAKAMQRGDWLRAYSEVVTALISLDRAVMARGHVRTGWVLARLGVSHYATNLLNQGLNEPTSRGEALLARAWVAWHHGQFMMADEQAALASQGDHPAPDWALAEWRQFRAAHAKAAETVRTTEAPGDVLTPAYLDYADRLRAAGAFNLADIHYEKCLAQLSALGANAPAAARALASRAAIGQREDLLSLWGGRLPAPDYAHVRVEILQRVRAAAAASMAQADWTQFFTLLAEVQANPGAIDLASFDLPGDLALAEKQAGLAPEWRDRLKSLLADPRLRYASRLAAAQQRCETHPAFATTPDIANAAKLDELFALLEAEQKVLGNLRALMPADAPDVPAQAYFDNVDALIRLRRALQQNDATTARAQFARIVESMAGPTRDDDTFKARVNELERRNFLTVFDKLSILGPEDLMGDEVLELTTLAEQALRSLRDQYESGIENPAALSKADLDVVISALYVSVLAGVQAEHVLQAEAALNRFEKWSQHDLVRDSAWLRAARRDVADMPMDRDELIGEENAILEAVRADQADRASVPKLQEAITKDPERLSPRILLALTYWRLAEDELAAGVIADIRRLAPHVTKLHERLDRFETGNDTARVCAELARQLEQATPENRDEVMETALGNAETFFRRINRVWNGGQPVTLETLKGRPPFNEYAQAYALVIRVHIAEGDLHRVLAMCNVLRTAGASQAWQSLQPAVERMPFRSDLPTPELATAWRTLITSRSVPPAELEKLYAPFRPHLGKSLSADLAYCLFLTASRDSDKAMAQLNQLRGNGRYNRAYARQLAAAADYIEARTEKRTILLFGNEQRTHSDWSNRQQELNNFVDANRAALKDAYDRNESTDLTRYVDRLEAEVNELKRIAEAEESKNATTLNEATKARQRKLDEALAELRALTL